MIGSSREAQVNFQVGDPVVYPPQGGGVVQEIVERTVLGEKQQYLKVVFVRGNMEVLVPLAKAMQVGLRRTMSAEEATRLAQQAEQDLDLPEQWPPRFRAEQEILARSDAFELSRLIGTLTRRDEARGLASTERDVLDNARALLASELAIVHDTTFEASERWIEENLLGAGQAS